MSLFGSNQPSSSLFGNNGMNTAPQSSTPFSKPPSGGLFSNAQGNNTTNGQPGNSLFPSTIPGSSQPPSTSSNLFMANLQTTQPQAQASGSTLFGNHSTQQQQQGFDGLFSTSASQSGQGKNNTALTSSLFGRTQVSQGQRLGTSQDEQHPLNNSNASMTTALFQNLLERGKSRHPGSHAGAQFGELPNIKLGLNDIASKVRHLGSSSVSPGPGDAPYSRGRYLLAASGIPRASTLHDLHDFNGLENSPSILPSPQLLDTDIDAYVNSLQAKSSVELFQDYMAQTKRDFNTFVEDRFQMDQYDQRKRIYEHFGLSKADDRLSAVGGEGPGEPRAGSSVKSYKGAKMSFGIRSDSPQNATTSVFLSKSMLGKSIGRGSLRNSPFSGTSGGMGVGFTVIAPDDRSQRAKQEKYASKIKALNLARLKEESYPVIEEFAKVEVESGEDAPQHIIDAYRALKRIVGENNLPERSSDSSSVPERHYARDYLDAFESGRSLEMKKRIIVGSKAHLEDSFFANVESVVSRNPREASLGGVPSKINKVRAYVRVRASRKDLGIGEDLLQKINDDFCWVLIFFLLRSGLVQEAAQYVSDHERELRIMDRGFPVYMALYANDPNKRLTPEIERKMDFEYQARRKNAPENSLDPYRLACYKIIGRCDLVQKTLDGVGTGLEDWMWVILSLAREVPRTEESAGRSFGLEDVRTMIDMIGHKHFPTKEASSIGYATYFYIQILAGMFEKAVAWLQPHNLMVAVHFAIALDFYGLLRVAEFSIIESSLLMESTSQKAQINFKRLLGFYTQGFRLARAAEACEYITLICLNSDLPGTTGLAHVSSCHEALKELVLETREFALLLGDVNADGKRTMGLIEQRVKLLSPGDQAEFLQSLSLQAAAVADDSGRVTDAVLLYHLAEEFDSVIAVINRALSESISVDIGRTRIRLQPSVLRDVQADSPQEHNQQHPETGGSLSLTSVDDPLVLAKRMIGIYNDNSMYVSKIRQGNRDACGILIRMSDARTRVEDGRWADAVDIITSLELLPLRAKGNVSIIRSTAQSFSSLPQVITRVIGNILIWTITCLGKQREAIKDSAFQTQRPLADDLLIMAKDLMVFAGLIRYKLPPNVFEILALGSY